MEPAGASAIKCSGICGNSFHISCLSKDNNAYKNGLIKLIANIPNLNWYCDNCLPFTLNGLATCFTDCTKQIAQLSTTLAPFLEQLTTTRTPDHVSAVDNQQQTVAPIVEFVPSVSNASDIGGGAMDTSANYSTVNGDSDSIRYIGYAAPDTPPRLHTVSTKRKLSDEVDATISSTKQQRLNGQANVRAASVNSTSRPSNSSNQTTPDVFPVARNPFAKTRSLYVSGYPPSTTVDDIMNHIANKKLDKNDIWRCDRLVSPFKRAHDLTFVSFKITEPEKCFETYANRALWPAGIDVRELENQIRAPKSDFRKREPAMRGGQKCSRSKHNIETGKPIGPAQRIANRNHRRRNRHKWAAIQCSFSIRFKWHRSQCTRGKWAIK